MKYYVIIFYLLSFVELKGVRCCLRNTSSDLEAAIPLVPHSSQKGVKVDRMCKSASTAVVAGISYVLSGLATYVANMGAFGDNQSVAIAEQASNGLLALSVLAGIRSVYQAVTSFPCVPPKIGCIRTGS